MGQKLVKCFEHMCAMEYYVAALKIEKQTSYFRFH